MSSDFRRNYIFILFFFFLLSRWEIIPFTQTSLTFSEPYTEKVADPTATVKEGVDQKPVTRIPPQEARFSNSDDKIQGLIPGIPAALAFEDITTTALGNTGAGAHSSTFADVTGDGRPDLYITMYSSSDISDLFYRNTNGSVFAEEGSSRGISDYDGGSHGSCFADMDNDGDYDLLNGTTVERPIIPGQNNGAYNDIYENLGTGSFVEVSPDSISGNRKEETRAIVAFDMESDGDLDIFAVEGFLGSSDPSSERNEVYRNDGNMVFTSITSGALYEAPAGQGATDTDYDGDGDIDIIAANRRGPVNVLRNDGGGTFTRIDPVSSIGIGAQHGYGISQQAGDGITMGDVNSDGYLDMLTVHADYDVAFLYMNDGDGTFTHNDQWWQNIHGYMGGFADLDNDGDLDLVFAGDTLYYLNDGNGNFSTSAPDTLPLSGIVDPRSIGFADIDDDGDMDFAVGDKQTKSRLIRNDLTSGGNWLKVRLVSPQGQAGAFGAKTRIYPGREAGMTLLGFRESRSSNGYLGQNDPVLHFGLGSNTTADVVVTFLDGKTATRTYVAANQTLTIDRADVIVQVKIYLQGPYDAEGDSMTTALNDGGYIPLTSPYSDDPRKVSSIPGKVTDWVLVQLRSTADGSAVASKSAFLRNDGRIVADNGDTTHITMDAGTGDYYIVIRHRNHLAVMSAATVALNDSTSTLYDFTTGPDKFYGLYGKELETGVFGIFAGDASGNGQVQNSDKNDYWKIQVGTAGYKSADFNLNGQVQNSDKNDYWKQNVGLGTQVQ